MSSNHGVSATGEAKQPEAKNTGGIGQLKGSKKVKVQRQKEKRRHQKEAAAQAAVQAAIRDTNKRNVLLTKPGQRMREWSWRILHSSHLKKRSRPLRRLENGKSYGRPWRRA